MCLHLYTSREVIESCELPTMWFSLQNEFKSFIQPEKESNHQICNNQISNWMSIYTLIVVVMYVILKQESSTTMSTNEIAPLILHYWKHNSVVKISFQWLKF